VGLAVAIAVAETWSQFNKSVSGRNLRTKVSANRHKLTNICKSTFRFLCRCVQELLLAGVGYLITLNIRITMSSTFLVENTSWLKPQRRGLVISISASGVMEREIESFQEYMIFVFKKEQKTS
jgi:hypothetical protein